MSEAFQFRVLLFSVVLLLGRLYTLILAITMRLLDCYQARPFEWVQIVQNRRIIEAPADQAILFQFVGDMDRMRQM